MENRNLAVHRRGMENRNLAAHHRGMAHHRNTSGMACNLREIAIIAIPSNLTETSNLGTLPVSNVTTNDNLIRNCSYNISPNYGGNREGSFTGYSPESSSSYSDQRMVVPAGYGEDVKVKNKDWGVKVKDKGLSSESFSYDDQNMVVPAAYNEDVKVKNKDWGVKVKDKGFSPDYSYGTTSAMPLNQGMANTEVVSTAGLCKVYQDGNTIIRKCPATNCATNCNVVNTPTTGVNIEREATFLGYFPKTCENLTPAPLPEPAPEPVMEQNLEPMPVAAPVYESSSCHRGCGERRVKVKRCGNRCNNY